MYCLNHKTFFRCLLIFVFATLTFSSFASISLTPEEEAYLEERGGVVRFVYHGNFMPIEFTNKDGDVAGIMPDFIRWLASRIGFEPEFYAATSFEAAEGLALGKYDADATYLYDEKPAEGLVVTPPVMEIPTFVFVPAASPIRSISDLHGAVIAVENPDGSGF